MDLQPTLDNELVRVRPLENSDLEFLYEVAKDPKIWEQHPCKRYLRAEFEKFFTESIESKGALTILDKTTGKIIGSSRYKKIDEISNGVEIGWTFLGKEFWGGKYNKAVKDLMIGHAYNYVDKIIFYVAKENIRSQKAVEKINGQEISDSDYPHLCKKDQETVSYILKRPIEHQ